MKIIHYSEAEPKRFDANNVKGVTGRIVIGKADGASNFCMRFFELSEGGYSPKHSHEWEHEIFIYSGKGAVFNNGEWLNIESGYSIFVPSNEEHQLKNIGDDTFVFVCIIPSGVPEM